MNSKIPKEIIDKIKKERKEDYDAGYEAGIEFTKESDYSTIDQVVDAFNYDDALRNLLGEHEYFESSSEFKEGFEDALNEVLKKSAED